MDNPFRTPKADLEVKTPEPDDVKAAKQIRNAWVAACISGGITAIIIGVAMTTGNAIAGIDAWAIGDLFIIFGLAFGIYRKSRTCAVLMLAYFVLSKAIMWSDAGKPQGIWMALIFAYFYAMGVAGTFKYHKMKKALAADA